MQTTLEKQLQMMFPAFFPMQKLFSCMIVSTHHAEEECDALKSQSSHAFYLDFIPSVLKEDGLWGRLRLLGNRKVLDAKEYCGEKSSYCIVMWQSSLHFKSKLIQLKLFLLQIWQKSISKLRIAGKILGK